MRGGREGTLYFTSQAHKTIIRILKHAHKQQVCMSVSCTFLKYSDDCTSNRTVAEPIHIHTHTHTSAHTETWSNARRQSERTMRVVGCPRDARMPAHSRAMSGPETHKENPYTYTTSCTFTHML